MERLVAALLLLASPAAADPNGDSRALYRAMLASELAFGNAYPSGDLGRPRQDLGAALEAALEARQECRSAATTLLSIEGLMRIKALPFAKASYAAYLAWRSGCEDALGLPAADRPLEATIDFHLPR